MQNSLKRSLTTRQFGLVKTYHKIVGLSALDQGVDQALVESVVRSSEGTYVVTFKALAQQNVAPLNLTAITPNVLLQYSASDKSSLTVVAHTTIIIAGIKATKVIQDLTYTADTLGNAGNSITIRYTTGGTAGSEGVTVVGSAITVQIQSGVSTATQVKAAIDGNVGAAALVDVAITGTAGTAQVAVAATALSGGHDAWAEGDVVDADFYMSALHSMRLSTNN